MKALVFSDLHEEESALERLKEFYERQKPDLVLSCGDLCYSVAFAEEVISSFKNFYFVPGNGETRAVNDFYEKQKGFLHKKRIEADGLNIVGFGFSPPTIFHTYGEKREDEIEREADGLPIDEKTILLLHTPPKGFFDKTNKGEHIGSDALLRLVKNKKPLACIFGHVHERIGFCKNGDTYLVKVPPAKDHKCVMLKTNNKKLFVEFIHL